MNPVAKRQAQSPSNAITDSCGCSYHLGVDFSIYQTPCNEHAPICSGCAGHGCSKCDGKGKDFSSQKYDVE